ncbi:MAG: 3-dehydroquinate synthase [Methylococcaceae bacterium TMED69]|nr:MAG: 3-dehydroquinate synthase [Methylococcaceae bacterium TMED69]|tara:strand:- start:263 stop:1336 length:1074 start_codon:yes stop_codon:yes gene_type:complete
MDRVKVTLPDKDYEILIGDGAINLACLKDKPFETKKILVLTDENVAKLHINKIKKVIRSKHYYEYIIKSGEEQKSLINFEKILEFMLTHQFDRESLIIALGGGVIGDLGGFVASCYQRGIGVFQIPTTLLAQVDSSVGGKTAVNHSLGKNMIGTFHQPLEVICDISLLETLPKREFLSGIAEIIKYGVIGDLNFFCWLEENIDLLLNRNHLALKYAIKRSCENKRDIVSEDEKEQGKRALLNFGHTFAHAIENLTSYNTWLHGEAVSIGMCMAAELSNNLGMINQQSNTRLKNLLAKSGLPTRSDSTFNVDEFITVMSLDKKNTNGQINLILLDALGKAVKKSNTPKNMISEVIKSY